MAVLGVGPINVGGLLHPADGLYRVAHNLWVTEAGRARTNVALPPNMQEHELNDEEATWYYARTVEIHVDQGVRAFNRVRLDRRGPLPVGGAGPLVPKGLPQFQNLSPARAACRAVWMTWTSPRRFLERLTALNRVPVVDPANLGRRRAAIRVHCDYANVHGHVPVHDWADRVDPAAPNHLWTNSNRWQTWRYMNANGVAAYTAQCNAEIRRRKYSTELQPRLPGAGDYADLYSDFRVDQAGAAAPRPHVYQWPIRVTFEVYPALSDDEVAGGAPLIRALPLGPVASGAWFPFFVQNLMDPEDHEWRTWMAQNLDVYEGVEELRRCRGESASGKGVARLMVNLVPMGVQCFYTSLARAVDVQRSTRAHPVLALTDKECAELRRMLLLGAGESGTDWGAVNIQQGRQLIYRLTDVCLEPDLKPLLIECIHPRRPDQTVIAVPSDPRGVLAQKMVHVYWGSRVENITALTTRSLAHLPRGGVQHYRWCRIGLVGGHYVPWLEVPGVHRQNLIYHLEQCQSEGSDGLRYKRDFRRPPVDSLNFLRILLALGRRHHHLIPIQLPYQEWVQPLSRIEERMYSRDELRALCKPVVGKVVSYSSAAGEEEDGAREEEEEEVEDSERKSKRQREPAGGMSLKRVVHFVVDYEDTSQEHVGYCGAVCLVEEEVAALSKLQVESFIFTPSVPRGAILTQFILRRMGNPGGIGVVWAHNVTYDFGHFFQDVIAAGGEPAEDGFLTKDSRVVTHQYKFGAPWFCVVHLRDSWRLFGPTMSVASMPKAFGFDQEEVAGEGPIGKEIFLHDWLGDGEWVKEKLWVSGSAVYITREELVKKTEESNGSEWCMTPFDLENFWVDPKVQFFQNAERTAVRLFEYAQKYCRQDVLIVSRALTALRCCMMELSEGKVDALNSLSASSLADQYLKTSGCYDGVVSISELVSRYFRKFITGGRCTTAYGWKCLRNDPIHGPLADVDARSLYPTAMVELSTEWGGFLRGCPEPIDVALFPTAAEILHYSSPYVGFFIECEVLSAAAPAPIEYPFGLYAFKPSRDRLSADVRKDGSGVAVEEEAESGVQPVEEEVDVDVMVPTGTELTSVQWVNDLRRHRFRGEVLYFDRISLTDYLQHQRVYQDGVDFRIRQGYGFRNGRNPTIGNVMLKMYEERRVSTSAAKSLLYKLLMNGSYGRTIQKAVPMALKVFNDEGRLNRYAMRHLDLVQLAYHYVPSVSSTHKILEVARPLLWSYIRPQIGAEILSQSRRVMNRKTCRFSVPALMNLGRPPPRPHDGIVPLGIPAYTDTDSVHCYQSDMTTVFIEGDMGPRMGQFHNDFEGSQEGVATDAMWLTKKMYVFRFDQDGTKVHAALKGISRASMNFVARRVSGNARNWWGGVYEPLWNGMALEFPLCVTDGPMGGKRRPVFQIRRRETGFAMRTVVDDLKRTIQVYQWKKRAGHGADEPEVVINVRDKMSENEWAECLGLLTFE